MLNEEKIRYMTELAIFEKNEGRKIFPVNRFFRSDYVGGQMFRGFFGYTFSFLLIVFTWAMYRYETTRWLKMYYGTESTSPMKS